MIRQDQIRQHAGFVDERSEADDERDALAARRPPSMPPAIRTPGSTSSISSTLGAAADESMSPKRARRRRGGRLRHEGHAARLTSTLPTSAFRALTASAWTRPLVCASGAPPMIATAGPCCGELTRQPLDRARPSHRSSPADRVPARTSSRNAPLVRRVADQPRAITCSRADAFGARACTATNSSAFAAVCDMRASTCTNFGRTPGCPWRIRP